ncbi:acyltransferase family protein [Rheinheimera sp. WS51]|uniref:acyltransferase family protein n=1 Tax=Rheinheimera sp. WS51 TaxID=3425886 RepID=UPI003D9114D0
MQYRREVDGLRAVAVMPVLFFHANFSLFSGGYVGVDVFFVISGYLITSILLNDISKDQFSLVTFYERRARRILPALFTVILFSSILAWQWLLPSDLINFSQSVIAVVLFVSNIFFWLDINYFDTAVELKPLLHTWSLAVEEQYYILFPPALWLMWRFCRSWLLIVLIFIFTVSLMGAEYASRYMPSANFYLVPTRIWEIMAGSLLAWYHFKPIKQLNDKVNSVLIANIFSTLGLGFIIYSIVVFDSTTPFPGIYALIPVIGSVLVLHFASKKTVVGRLLSTKAFVGIGLVSYSIYLWHQPLFSFARIRSLHEPSINVFIVLIFLTLAFSYFSWRFIEAPFRNKQKYATKTNFYLFGGGIFIVTSGSFFGHSTKRIYTAANCRRELG